MTRTPLKDRLRKFFRVMMWIGLLLLLYGIFIESSWLQVERVDVHLRKLPAALDGFRIVHLTDIHYPRGFNDAYFQRVVKTANNLHPDLIVITGDFITRVAEDADGCARILHGLQAKYGVLAVLGNHDFWTSSVYVERALRGNGIRVLRNAAVPVRHNGARL